MAEQLSAEDFTEFVPFKEALPFITPLITLDQKSVLRSLKNTQECLSPYHCLKIPLKACLRCSNCIQSSYQERRQILYRYFNGFQYSAVIFSLPSIVIAQGLGFSGCSHHYQNVEIAKSVRLDHRIFDSSQWWIFVGKASITFQTEFVFPLPFNSSERTFSFFAILITRLTSCLKNRKTFQ